MFGLGSPGSSTSYRPTNTTTSSRQDNDEREERPSTFTTSTSTSTASELPKLITPTSVHLMPPPSNELAQDPLLLKLYEKHIELHAIKKSLLERREKNSQILRENQQSESSDINVNRMHQVATCELNTPASPASLTSSPFLRPQPVSSQTQVNRAHQVATHVFNPLEQQTIPPLTALPAALSAIPSTFSPQSLVQPSLPVPHSSPYSLNSTFSTSSGSSWSTIQLQDAYTYNKLFIENAEDLEKKGFIRQAEGVYCYLLRSGGASNVQVLGSYGKFLNNQENFQKAEIYLKAALQISYSIEIAVEYIHCLIQQYKRAEAKQQIENILSQLPFDNLLSQKCRAMLLELNS